MADYSEHTGRTKMVVLEPQITRAFWSRRRAWQDEEVKLHVETRYVADGTPLELSIWEAPADEKETGELVTTLSGSYQIKNNRCEAAYKIKWDKGSIGKELKLQRDEWEFHFLATIKSLGLQKKSGLLYVDLHRLIPSL